MKLDDLIEKLYELKKEYGNLEVILFTQSDAWSYDEHDIAGAYRDDEDDNLIVIEGKEKTEGKE